MFYYIRTEKEANYEISEPFSTHHEAKEKLSHMHKKNKDKSKIIEIPEIREGLNLFKANGSYLTTIIGESKTLFFCNRLDERKELMDDAYQKDTILNWFVKEKLYPAESYAEGVEFVHIQDLSFDDEDAREIGENSEKIS